MKVDLSGSEGLSETDKFLATLLGHVVVECTPPKLLEKHFGEGGDRQLNITMFINGFDVDPKIFFDHIHESLEELIIKEATEILKRKFTDIQDVSNDIFDKIESIKEEIKSLAKERLNMDWI